MWYKYLDKTTKQWITQRYDDVDVYLQGTSSLQYPVKNYQIKNYSTKIENGETTRDKAKFIPPNKGPEDGWIVADSVYTLKCDYMEQSHRNNTPTAILYGEILDTVANKISSMYEKEIDLSPAKRITTEIETFDEENNKITKVVNKYRDSINGFPCLVYYNDNDDSLIDYNDVDGDEYNDNKLDNLAGTFMFNVDKEGKSLGFELECEEQDALFEDGTNAKDKEDKDIKIDILPCVSLEGSSNADVAAATFYTMDEYNDYNYTSNLKSLYKDRKIEEVGISYDEYYNNAQTSIYSDITSKAVFMKIDGNTDLMYGIYLTDVYNDYLTKGIIDSNCDYNSFYEAVQESIYSDTYNFETYKKTKGFTDEYKYINSTFDIRYSYADDLYDDGDGIIDETTFNRLTFDRVKNTIDWLTLMYENIENATDVNVKNEYINRFTTEFENYFSYSYCMTYYLQMMMFTQVDNAGKNAMFDSWGGKLYPRPYDMDTQMGETNTGSDSITVSAEINPDISPKGILGSKAANASVSNTNDNNHHRYSTYNTRLSKLWTLFAKYFKTDILACYSTLRSSGIYNADYIFNKVSSLTSDIIGEKFYNKDAAAKYLTQTKEKIDEKTGLPVIDGTHLAKLQGNRENRYKQFIKERIIFLDTFFGYNGSNSLNSTIEVRTDVPALGLGESAKFGISVYTPQYVTVTVGSNDVTVTTYIDQNSSYIYDDGDVYDGVLFTLPFGANDKDIIISGAGNIRSINHMSNLNIKEINLDNAKKLTNINITRSTNLVKIQTDSNTYLRSINLNDSLRLTGSLNLSSCLNLKTLDISNTGLTSVSLPVGGCLTSFKAANCALSSLVFDNLPFLSTLDITGCQSTVSTIAMHNCPLINELDISGFTSLLELNLSGCKGITKLDLQNTTLSELSIQSCDSLSEIIMTSCSGSIMSNLNLTTVYGLKTLKLNSASPSSGINLFLPEFDKQYAELNETQKNELIDKGVDIFWHGLTNLDLRSSTIKNIYSGNKSLDGIEDDAICDFTKLTNLKELKLKSCLRIKKVNGLRYVDTYELFNECKNLETITNCTFGDNNNNSVSMMFYNCNNLNELTDCTFNFEGVKGAKSTFAYCKKIKYATVKSMLDSIPNVTNLSSFLFSAATENNELDNLSADMFSKNTQVTEATSIFAHTNVKTVHGSIFNPFNSTIVNLAGAFYYCSHLGTIGNHLLHNKPNLKYTNAMFMSCSSLESYLNSGNSLLDIFHIDNKEGNRVNSKVSNTRMMFANCNKLYKITNPSSEQVVNNNLKVLFDRLPELKYTAFMFANCTKLITELPDGIFESNKKLIELDGIFVNCTGLKNLPSRLFISDPTSSYLTDGTITHPDLLYARSVFANCTNLEGIIQRDFFKGAGNITHICHINNDELVKDPEQNSQLFSRPVYSTATYYFGGIFANTKIESYYYNFLSCLPNLQYADFLFYKGTYSDGNFVPGKMTDSIDLTGALTGFCKLDDKNDLVDKTGIYSGIFDGLINLKRVRYAFAGNKGLECFRDIDFKVVDYNNLLADCKEKLTDAEGLFANCTNLEIEAPTTLFNNCTRLETVRAAFAYCKSLFGSIDENIFLNCNNLKDTSYMFYNCIGLGKSDTENSISIPAGIFDSCRSKINNTSYMFAGCGFNGCIGTGEAEIIESEIEGEPDILTVTKNGLLAECIKLSNASYMFAGCKTLKGAIPEDMFYTVDAINSKYNELMTIKGLFFQCEQMCLNSETYGISCKNMSTVYGFNAIGNEDYNYLIPSNWGARFTKKLSDISLAFCQVGSMITQDDTQLDAGTRLKINSNLFSGLQGITTITSIFENCKILTGNLSRTFLEDSLNTLEFANKAFAFSNIVSVGDETGAIFEKEGRNRSNSKLKEVKLVLYSTYGGNMTGYGPKFYLNTSFSALSLSDYAVGNQTMLSNKNYYSDIQISTAVYAPNSTKFDIPETYAVKAIIKT